MPAHETNYKNTFIINIICHLIALIDDNLCVRRFEHAQTYSQTYLMESSFINQCVNVVASICCLKIKHFSECDYDCIRKHTQICRCKYNKLNELCNTKSDKRFWTLINENSMYIEYIGYTRNKWVENLNFIQFCN